MESCKEENWIRDLKKNFDYVNPTLNNEFPIVGNSLLYNGAQVCNPSRDSETAADFSCLYDKMMEFKNAGFNVCLQAALGNGDLQQENNWLNKASQAKITIVAGNSYYFQKDPDIGHLDKNPSFGGFRLYDEPSIEQLNENRTESVLNNPSKLIDQYYNIMCKNPTKIVFINLLGEPCAKTGTNNSLDFSSLEKYAEAYQQNFKPSFFCFDCYPISETANLLYEGFSLSSNSTQTEGTVNIKYQNFHEALRIYSEISRKNNVPFWSYCESLVYMNFNSRFYRPVATETYLRFEIFTALAYGAKGIAYFTYSPRDNSTGEVKEIYFSAILDRRGNKTASYYYAQKINNEIKKYQEIFLNSKLESLIHINSLETRTILDGRIGINVKFNSAEGIICSVLSSSNQTYIMIVSKDVLNYQDISININGGGLQELTPIHSNGLPSSVYFTNITLQRIMIPGGYRLFHFRP